jgi:3-oxoacyl-[acyl-carrier protein] reductase
MDTGLRGKSALVCAASKGLGRACAMALAQEGVNVTITARGAEALEATAAGDFRDWGREDWIKAVDANMLTPIFLIKAVVDGMIARKFGRIVNITSASVKSPIAHLGMSNGARAGLTGFVGGLARQVARHNVTINGLLPGPFNTERLKVTLRPAAAASGRPVEDLVKERAKDSPSGRVGEPEEFGAACAFLCSAQAGYIVGQNLVLDGGLFNSTMG